MESTEIAASKSAVEVSALLVTGGARSISTEFGADGSIVGLKFELAIEGVNVAFALPVRVEPIYKYLSDRRKAGRSRPSRPETQKAIREQAERVAWRQLLRWVQAQLAMIEVQMVQPQEVFLPYLLPHAGSSQTFYEFFQANGIKQLTAGAGK